MQPQSNTYDCGLLASEKLPFVCELMLEISGLQRLQSSMTGEPGEKEETQVMTAQRDSSHSCHSQMFGTFSNSWFSSFLSSSWRRFKFVLVINLEVCELPIGCWNDYLLIAAECTCDLRKKINKRKVPSKFSFRRTCRCIWRSACCSEYEWCQTYQRWRCCPPSWHWV